MAFGDRPAEVVSEEVALCRRMGKHVRHASVSKTRDGSRPASLGSETHAAAEEVVVVALRAKLSTWRAWEGS